MTRYLTAEDAVRQVVRYGLVMRDSGLFASAIERPAQTVFGEDAYKTLWDQAAAMCQSIDHNQALLDGNKPVAWALTKLFLWINGQRLAVTDHDGATFMLEVVAAGRPLDEIAAWLSANCGEIELPDLGDDS